jgi:S-adenosylmethionine uptake transporter
MFPNRLSGSLVGPLLALVAFGLYATHDVIVKVLGTRYNVFQILFFAGLLSFPLAAALLMRDRTPGTLMPVHLWWVLLRTVAIILAGLGGFYAFTVLPLAQTYAILFATPLMVTLLSIPVLGERVGIHRGLAVILGLIGVLIVLRPGGEALSLGHLAALMAALATATSGVVVRKLGNSERSMVLMLYPILGSVLLMGALMVPGYVALELIDLALMGLVALLGFVATLLVIYAYRMADAAVVAPMQYSQMLWAVLYGTLFFGEVPDFWTLVGAGVITASGLYILSREARRDVSTNQPVTAMQARVDGPAAIDAQPNVRHLP